MRAVYIIKSISKVFSYIPLLVAMPFMVTTILVLGIARGMGNETAKNILTD